MAAPNSVPRFTLPSMSPGHGLVSAANTNRDGTGTIVDILTAPATPGQGALVEVVRIKAIGTTTAGMIRIFRKDGGAVYRLVKELPVAAIVPSGTVESFEAEWVPTGGLAIPPGWALGVSTHVAESFHASVTAGGDY